MTYRLNNRSKHTNVTMRKSSPTATWWMSATSSFWNRFWPSTTVPLFGHSSSPRPPRNADHASGLAGDDTPDTPGVSCGAGAPVGGSSGGGGGGWFRRFMNFQQQMFHYDWTVPDGSYYPPIHLFDFHVIKDDTMDALQIHNVQYQKKNSNNTWRFTDDRVIGGYTQSNLIFFANRMEYKQYCYNQQTMANSSTSSGCTTSTSSSATDSNNSTVEMEQDTTHRDTVRSSTTSTSTIRTNESTVYSTTATKKDSMEHYDRHDDPLTDEEQENDFIPFLRWEGILDTTISLQTAVQRSGFAAIRSPSFNGGIFWNNGANLQGQYNALEITCRTDGRLYKLNLHINSSIPDDIYQGYIHIPKEENKDEQQEPLEDEHFISMNNKATTTTRTTSQNTPIPRVLQPHHHHDEDNNKNGHFFTSYILEFNQLRATALGRERWIHRQLDDQIRIESIGIVLMDNQNGPFQFDLARIRAVNLVDHTIYEGDTTTSTTTSSSTTNPSSSHRDIKKNISLRRRNNNNKRHPLIVS